MDFNITKSDYNALLQEISSADSPVGIDAAKTHVLILHKLMQIEARLETLEAYFNDEEE